MYKRRQSYQKHERQFGTRHDKSKYKLKPQTTVVMGKVENASGSKIKIDLNPPPPQPRTIFATLLFYLNS